MLSAEALWVFELILVPLLRSASEAAISGTRRRNSLPAILYGRINKFIKLNFSIVVDISASDHVVDEVI